MIIKYNRNRRYFLRKAYLMFAIIFLIGVGLLVAGYFFPELSTYFYSSGGGLAFLGMLCIIIKKLRTPTDSEIDGIFGAIVKNSVSRARQALGLPYDASKELFTSDAILQVKKTHKQHKLEMKIEEEKIKLEKSQKEAELKASENKTAEVKKAEIKKAEELKAAEEKKKQQEVYKTEIDAYGNIVQKVEYVEEKKAATENDSALLKILNSKISKKAEEKPNKREQAQEKPSIKFEPVIEPVMPMSEAFQLNAPNDESAIPAAKPLQLSAFTKEKIFSDVFARVGKDKIARYSNISTFLLLLEKESIVAYTFIISIIKNEYIENVEEYFYKDIVSIATVEECMSVSAKGAAPVSKKLQKLVVTTTAGTTLNLSFNANEDIGQTILDLRKMVRQKRL